MSDAAPQTERPSGTASGAASGAAPPPAIEIAGLYKRFGDFEVLRGVDLVVPSGTTTVVLGGSGSGKSVLLRHIIGLMQPDAGTVRIDGQPLAGLEGDALQAVRAKFGMVFQMGALFDSMNVFDNVAFPLVEHEKLPAAEIASRVRAKLALLGLEATEAKYPAELSGGMRKRVALARAVVRQPSIVLYDEPTTGLDPLTTGDVNDMIGTAKRELGVTSVVISHDIGAAFAVADQVAILNAGVMIASGPPEVVRASEHPYVRRFLDTWFART